MERSIGSWRYEDPGDGRLLSVDKTVARCNFASRTGVAFFQTQRIPCFNIPELESAKEVWIKFDAYLYHPSDSKSAVIRCYDETSGQTGLAINPYRYVGSNCVNVWVNGTCIRSESRTFFGFHSIKIHLVSDATNGLMEVFLDNNTPYLTYKGNVNNGNLFTKLYIQCDRKYVLVSNLIIGSDDIDIHELVPYEAKPYRYVNLGTADGLTVAGTTVESTEYSRTGTAFYQTQRVGCFGVPMMDEVWIKFDLYHKAGTSRFRCYVNPDSTSGICLSQNTSSIIAIFHNNVNASSNVDCVQENTIQTYIVHIASGYRRRGVYGFVVEYYVDGVLKKSYTPTNIIPPLDGLYLQSDDENNLFSNIVIASTKDALEDAQVGAFEFHTDIQRTSARYWRYENAGIIEAFPASENLSQYGRNVRCNFASRTGVGFYITKTFSLLPVVQEKELWVKFDIYAGKSSRTGNTTESYCIRCFDWENRTGIVIKPDSTIEIYINDKRVTYYSHQIWGFHSIKLHYVSNKTNGLFEVYLDSDDVRHYSYKGNVCNGDVLKNLYFQSDDNRGIFSNVVVSTFEPSVNEVVPYNKGLYSYTNKGEIDAYMTNGVVVETPTKSRTGTAFYQTEWKIGLSLPEMDEMWVQFDLYHHGTRFWAEAASIGNKEKMRVTGVCIQNNTVNTLLPIIEDYNWSLSKNIQEDKIQTYLLHLVSGANGGKVEVWVDDVKQFVEDRTGFVIPSFQGFLFYSKTDDNLFSNIAISDKRENLALDVYNVEYHADISCEIQSSKHEVDEHFDIMRELIELTKSHHFDILRNVQQSFEQHSDIKRRIVGSDYTLAHYENRGYTDYSYAVNMLCRSISRTGVGMTHDVWRCPTWDVDVRSANTNEMWVKIDVFAWDERTSYQPWADISFYTENSNCKASIYFCAVKDPIEAGVKLWRHEDGITPSATYDMNKYIGFHTIKVHVIADKLNGLIECFLDNSPTSCCVFHGNVCEGEGIESIQVYGNNFTTTSNMIVDAVSIDSDDVVAYDGNNKFAWSSEGRIEDLNNNPIVLIDNGVFTGGVASEKTITVAGSTVMDATKSHTGVAFYQTQQDANCVSMPVVDEMWVQFDLYHHGETYFSCFISPDDDATNGSGIGSEPCRNFGIRLKNGTSDKLEIIIGKWILTTVDIVPDTIQTYRMHVIAYAESARIKLWIDGEQVAYRGIDRGVGYFTSPCFYSSNADNLFSNVTVSNNEEAVNSFAIHRKFEEHFDIGREVIDGGTQNIIQNHFDISREVEFVKPPHKLWRYENPGVIDGEWGTSSDKQYWSDRHLFEIHGAVSKTGTAIAQKNPDAYPHLYFKLPDEAKYFDELWVKFDWCICAHGGYEFPYLWMSGYAIDINGASNLRNVSEDGEVLIAPDGRSIPARVPPNNNPYEDDTTWVDTTIPFSVHTLMLHYAFDYTDGLFEAYLDDDSVPIYSASGRMRPIDEVTMEIADIGISNIVISNEKVDFNEVIGRIHIPNTEGVATHKTIDLEKELTVGIGISIEGEGYAMIRTAGEDGHYTAWENYIPCERLCRYIDVRLHVRNKITSATLTVDKRTVSKTISKHLAAGDNTVEYGEVFYNIPAVIPTAIGDGVTAHVISKDTGSCVIKITDNNNNAVEGDVDILIRGW